MAEAAKSLRLSCLVVPKSSEDKIVGWQGEALKIKLRAAPTDGKANDALRTLLADSLGIKARDIVIASGAGSRRKLLVCQGIDKLPAHLHEQQD